MSRPLQPFFFRFLVFAVGPDQENNCLTGRVGGGVGTHIRYSGTHVCRVLSFSQKGGTAVSAVISVSVLSATVRREVSCTTSRLVEHSAVPNFSVMCCSSVVSASFWLSRRSRRRSLSTRRGPQNAQKRTVIFLVTSARRDDFAEAHDCHRPLSVQLGQP